MRFGRLMATVVMAGALAACGGDEDDPTGGGHGTVVDVAIYGDVSPDPVEVVELIAGEANLVIVRFLDEHGEVVEGLHPDHAAALVIEPAGFASVATVVDPLEPGFPFLVTPLADAGEEGTLTVGYGHDGHTDEQTFGPFDVVVVE